MRNLVFSISNISFINFLNNLIQKNLIICLVPPFFVNVTNDLTVDEGSDVTLVCDARGKPPPEIIWRHLIPSGFSFSYFVYILLFNLQIKDFKIFTIGSVFIVEVKRWKV